MLADFLKKRRLFISILRQETVQEYQFSDLNQNKGKEHFVAFLMNTEDMKPQMSNTGEKGKNTKFAL